MHPILFEIPSRNIIIASYGTLIALAAVICIFLIVKLAKRDGMKSRDVTDALLLMGLSVFLGMRIHFAIAHAESFGSGITGVFKIWKGGAHAPGGLLLMAVATPFILKWKKIPIGRFADIVAPVAGIGMFISRIGCFLGGCCFGKTCDYPWAVAFPAGSPAHDFQVSAGLIEKTARASLEVHPLELYFALMGLTLAAVALLVRKYKRYDGQAALVVFFLYAIGKLVLESFRAQPLGGTLFGLPQLQVIGIALAILFGSTLIAMEVYRARVGHPQPPVKKEGRTRSRKRGH